jgi:hypothetical protein
MYCGCDRAGQLGERGSLGKEGRGEGRGYSEVLRWKPPSVSIKDHVVLVPMASFDLYRPLGGFLWGLVNSKPSSPGPTLSNHPSLL